jgi:hypothetical protein
MGVPYKIFDWQGMQRLIDDEQGGFKRCHQVFGIAHATWIKAIKRGDLRVDMSGRPYSDARKRYDWAAIQRFYDVGNTYRACRVEFGFSAASWTKAIRRGELRPRAQRLTLEQLFDQPRSRSTVKRHLLKAGILFNVCEECGLDEWRGKSISIQVDHRNGIRDDHRIENLRMLCPNCHSQTDTFGARNRGRNKTELVQSRVG